MALNTPVCEFGWRATDFELTDTSGSRQTLSTLRGANGLLLMFICNHCPYVKAIIDRICPRGSSTTSAATRASCRPWASA